MSDLQKLDETTQPQDWAGGLDKLIDKHGERESCYRAELASFSHDQLEAIYWAVRRLAVRFGVDTHYKQVRMAEAVRRDLMGEQERPEGEA